ncbi:MAG: hypothetical protein M1839_006109 [Geoglossum umbratile]|nr:MAG: hypothetical protein M1839_006109 [Geoglossum umbratile]
MKNKRQSNSLLKITVTSAGSWTRMELSRFCEFIDESDPYDAIQRAPKGTCMGFLRWILENYNVPKKSSTQQYWRRFKMLYVRYTGRRMNENDAREVFKRRRTLEEEVRSGSVSRIKAERQRVQLPMILITAAYTASRPGGLVGAGRKKEKGYEPWDGLDDSDYDNNRGEDEEKRCKALCYEDICLMLLRNPNYRDRDVLTMEVQTTHHKGAERKPKPTTFLFHEENNPIFYPITRMLNLAFMDHAFEAPSLKRAEDIFKRPSSVKLRCVDGFRTSPRKALWYSTFDYYLERLGRGTGFEEKLSGYCARRGTGNAVDGAATKAVRDKVMRHDPKSNIFEAYLNERVKFDVQAAFLERPSRTDYFVPSHV